MSNPPLNSNTSFLPIDSSPFPPNLKKLKRFYKFFKTHKFQASDTLSLVNQAISPTPFRFTLQIIENIPGNKLQFKNAPFLKIFATFFSKLRNKFFGRTYISQAYRLRKKEEGSLELIDPLFFHYLTRLDRNSGVVVVMEVVLIELGDRDEVLKTSSLGWVEIPGQAESKARMNLKKGSPNSLMNPGSSAQENNTISLAYELVIDQELLRIKNMMPESLIMGGDEPIPGIAGRFLRGGSGLKMDHTLRCYLSRIQITLPRRLEGEILRLGQKFAELRAGGVLASKNNNLGRIEERRFMAGFHNGWTLINSRGGSNVLTLAEGEGNMWKDGGEMREELEGTRMEEDNIRGKLYLAHNGTLEIDNVVLDEFGVLVLQFEYILEVSREMVKEVVGWLVLPLGEDMVRMGEIEVAEEMMIGPAKNLNGEPVVDLGLTENECVMINALLTISDSPSSNRIPTMTDGLIKSNLLPQSSARVTKSQLMMQGGQGNLEKSLIDEELRQKVLLNEKQKEMEMKQFEYEDKMKKELEELRILKEQYTSNKQKEISAEMEKKVLQGRELEYQKHMEAWKDFQYSNQMKTQNEFEELKSMIQNLQQQRETDQQKLAELSAQAFHPILQDTLSTEKMNIINNIISVPRKAAPLSEKAFILQPDYGIQDLSRADKAHLLQAGIRGLLDELPIDHSSSQPNIDLSIELNDPLQSSVILLQFLAIRNKKIDFVETNHKMDSPSLWSSSASLPSRLYFTLNFFDFPTFKTDILCVEAQSKGPQILIKESYLKGQEDAGKDFGTNKEGVYKWEVDGCEDWVRYLGRRTLTIDVWDAESLMMVGIVKVPLKMLMRQGRQVATLVKEFDVIEPNFERIRGGVQLLIKHIGKRSEGGVMGMETRGGMRKEGGGKNKRKVKSSTPMQLPQGYGRKAELKIDPEILNDPDKRMKERIKRQKMRFLERELRENEPPYGETDLQKKLILEINNYKDEKKPEFVKSILSSFLSQTRKMKAGFGKSEILEFEFVNKENSEQVFSINIDDSFNEEFKGEFSLINNSNEWRYLVEKRGGERPPEWNMISQENVMVLGAKEKITLLFKFLSFASPKFHDAEANQRRFNVYFNILRGRVYDGFSVAIDYRQSIVDHVFRYFERENRQVNLVLPALYYFTQTPISKPLLHITYPKSVVEWLNEKEIMVQLKTPSVAKIMKFNLLAYEDSYYVELLGNWEVEVHSYAGMDINVNMGQLTGVSLTVPGDTPRVCKLFSSHPLTAYFPTPFDRAFTLAPGKLNTVELNVKSFVSQTQKIQLNCVDINTKELIYAWILRVDTNAPNVTKIFELSCRLGVESLQKFAYPNKTTSYSVFEFTSSHPDILQLVETRIGINGGEKETIRVRIPARNQHGNAIVYVFSVDQDEKVFECMQFKIKYGD